MITVKDNIKLSKLPPIYDQFDIDSNATQGLKPSFRPLGLDEPEVFLDHLNELKENAGSTSSDDELDKCCLKLSYKVKNEEPSIVINGTNILSPGQFGCITGLPGSGKSSIIESFIVAFLASRHNLDNLDTLGIKIRSQGRKCVLLDTENPPDDNRKSLARIEKRLKLSENENLLTETKEEIQGFKYFMFVKLKTLEKLKESLREVYETGEYELVIIDGILDFVASMNNEEDTREIVQWIRAMGVKHNCTTLMTLHPNKNTETMAGHLGSNIYRWGRACFLVRNCEGDETVKELTTEFSMGKLSHANMSGFEPVYFTWDDTKNLMVKCAKPQKTGFNSGTVREIFNQYFINGKGNQIPSTELRDAYAHKEDIAPETARKHIKMACDDEILNKSGNGKNTVYFLVETEDEEAPF